MSERMNTNRSTTASPVSICRVADMLAAIGIPESDDSCWAAAASTAAMPEISTARCLNGAGHASGASIMQNEAAPATRPVIESPGTCVSVSFNSYENDNVDRWQLYPDAVSRRGAESSNFRFLTSWNLKGSRTVSVLTVGSLSGSPFPNGLRW